MGKRKEQGEKPFVVLSSWEGDAAGCEQDGVCSNPIPWEWGCGAAAQQRRRETKGRAPGESLGLGLALGGSVEGSGRGCISISQRESLL